VEAAVGAELLHGQDRLAHDDLEPGVLRDLFDEPSKTQLVVDHQQAVAEQVVRH
jgi:hypothetical protein